MYKSLLLVTVAFIIARCVCEYHDGTNSSSPEDSFSDLSFSGDSDSFVNSTSSIAPPSRVGQPFLRLDTFSKHYFNKRNNCGIRLYEQVISYPNCVDQRVKFRGCRGSCTSSARPLVNERHDFSVKCTCCKETSLRKGRVHLRCPRDPIFKVRKIVVQGVTSCACRPCISSS
ncbi:bursicon-like [Corticium candelabrum]|uniref:bursicon-like n=1 Tax=Corticium candelabrum TaxID=121492 RepID=UPI002E267D08|nr:bursicon-like [Corticium candelabrum]